MTPVQVLQSWKRYKCRALTLHNLPGLTGDNPLKCEQRLLPAQRHITQQIPEEAFTKCEQTLPPAQRQVMKQVPWEASTLPHGICILGPSALLIVVHRNIYGSWEYVLVYTSACHADHIEGTV